MGDRGADRPAWVLRSARSRPITMADHYPGMFRTLLTAICTVEVLAPATLISAAERAALENHTECEWRSWVTPGARLEGLLFLALLWRSDESYAAFKRFLGAIGLLALCYPHVYVDYGSRLAYTPDSTPDWRPWVYTGTRLVGLCYVLISLDELRHGPLSTK